jgi:universal stress protein A
MFHKILVPLDGSKESEQALKPACSLARAFQAELRLVTVEELPNQPEPSEWDLTIGSFLDKIREQVQKNLDRVAQDLRAQELRVTTAILPLGPPSARILEETAESQADLIVLFSHGRSGLSRFLMGSVAERLTRNAPCPVLIVRQSKVAASAG